jgi:hypothetical protein
MKITRFRRVLPFIFLTSLCVVSALLLARPNTRIRADGDAGWALQFNGSDNFIRLTRTVDMFGSGVWTDTKSVSLWVRPQGSAVACYNDSPAWCDLIFGDRPTSWGVARGIIDGKDRLWVWNYSGEATGFQKIGVEYIPDEWVHITLVHADGVLHAYRNGYEVAAVPSGTTQPPPNSSEEPYMQIGGFFTSDSRFLTFQGEIDEIRAFAIPIDEASVRANLQNSLTGTEAGLVAYYQMSDGIIDSIPAAQLTDDSLHGNTGAAGSNGTFPTWVNSSAFDLPVIYPTLTFTPTFTRTRLPTFTPTATATQTLLPSPTHQVVAQPSGYQVFLPSINR